MKPIVKTLSGLSDDADGIAEAQTASGAEDLTLDGALVSGGVATLAAAQQIVITSVGDDTGVTFTITGTDANGTVSVITLVGVNAGAATSTGHLVTVTNVATSGATAADVTVGVDEANGAVTAAIRVNRNQVSSFKLGLYVVITGTATYTVEHSEDWPESGDFTGGYPNQAEWRDTDGLTALTATDEGNINFPMETVRLNITAFTAGATGRFTVQQNY